jgi:dTDP-4-dehydrorhamnose reductase
MKELSGDPQGWARLIPITTDQYPLPAQRPPRPVMSLDKVRQAFDIAVPHWREQVNGFLRELTKSTRLGV